MGRGLTLVRRILFWMHLGAGVLVSVLVLFFSITGSLIAYERQILHAADERAYHASAEGGERVPLGDLMASSAAKAGAPVESVTVYAAPGSPVEIQTANREIYFANPYSGKVEGPESPRLRAFFAQVTGLHRWFGLGNAHHAAATALKGAATLLLLFLILSGAILWLPGVWTRSTLRAGVVPRFDTQGRTRDYNWHKVTGFWLALPLGIVVGTGVIMAYPWANALLFRAAGSPLPAPRTPPPANARNRRSGEHGMPNHLDEAFALATSSVPDWKSASLRLGPGPLSFNVDRSEGGHPEKREQVSIDGKTLQVMKLETFSTLSRGQRWRGWVRFTHTGEAGGWWGETLALAAALGAIVLSLTGILLTFDRWSRWRGRVRREQVQP
jgi:uncharacterized iron-regulated membrane protein